MLRKLTEEKQAEILERAISEFAEHGLNSTGMQDIARKAGLSVGVLYKYYENKEALFLACVRHVTGGLGEYLEGILAEEKKTLDYARLVIDALRTYSLEHADYIRLYHVITGTERYAPEMAKEIESGTAALYTRVIAAAQASGHIRNDMDPGMLAFFFDNLLMMTHFSYCCPYYRERLKLYCGDTGPEDSVLEEQLLKFIDSAFSQPLEAAEI